MVAPGIQIELPEWGACFQPELALSERDQRLAHTIRGVEIRDMRNGIYIKASSWVGVIRFETFTLHIHPKLSNVDMMRMIMVTSGLKRLQHYRAVRDFKFEDSISLFDLIALLLADACVVVARDGLMRGYVVEENDLPVMRGGLRVMDQMRKRFGQVNRLECIYDDHHCDIVENQILNTALEFCRQYVQHPLVRKRIWQLADTFNVACGPLSGDWREIRTGMEYNRLNTRYKEAHTLAWIILDGLGIKDLMASGIASGGAFLLDMNSLFEDFVTILIEKVLQADGFTIQGQSNSAGHIWDIGRDRSYKEIIPDLLIKAASGEQLVIDAKYKRYDKRDLAPDDIYQIFLYAYAFSSHSERMPSALLLYPSEDTKMNHTRLDIRNIQGNQKARLHALGIDIPRALNYVIGQGDEEVCERIHAIIQELLK